MTVHFFDKFDLPAHYIEEHADIYHGMRGNPNGYLIDRGKEFGQTDVWFATSPHLVGLMMLAYAEASEDPEEILEATKFLNRLKPAST